VQHATVAHLACGFVAGRGRPAAAPACANAAASISGAATFAATARATASTSCSGSGPIGCRVPALLTSSTCCVSAIQSPSAPPASQAASAVLSARSITTSASLSPCCAASSALPLRASPSTGMPRSSSSPAIAAPRPRLCPVTIAFVAFIACSSLRVGV
jgi:hypothetical protein